MILKFFIIRVLLMWFWCFSKLLYIILQTVIQGYGAVTVMDHLAKGRTDP